MSDREKVLRDTIHNTKEVFDLHVFKEHDFSIEWKLVNQYPWQLLQERLAPLAAELRRIEEARQ